MAEKIGSWLAETSSGTGGRLRWLREALANRARDWGYFPHLSSWPPTLAQGGAIRLDSRNQVLNYLPMKPGGGNGGRLPDNQPGVPGPGEFYHEPILSDEVVSHLCPAPGKLILDATVGGGGHSERLLKAGATVVGFDHDPDALSYAKMRLVDYESDFTAIRENFRNVGRVFEEVGIEGVDGMLLDLGVSSYQLDTPARGFSFNKPGPLDMRMNPAQELSARELVNSYDEEELARIFYEYGQERSGLRIARAIVRRREQAPLETTLDLANLVESVRPRRGKTHPATRVFQALRIAVNDELGALHSFLENARRWLKPGGRLAILTFHSLEDSIVKNYFRRCSRRWEDRPEWPEPRLNPDFWLELVLRKPLAPSVEEVKSNPRARSAKLRVVEKINYEKG